MNLFDSHVPDTVGDRAVPGSEPPPPRARTPRTRDHVDLDDWEVPTARTGSRRWLLAAAVVPWAVVVAVMVSGARDGASAPADDVTPAAEPTAEPVPAATLDARPTDEPAIPSGDATSPGTIVALGEQAGPSRRGEAEGLAVVVARTWLSTRPAGPPIAGLDPVPGAADQYVEHLAVESVDHPARGAAVVTVRAVVLPVEGEAYGTARQLRVAVPVVLDADAPRLAGSPWFLDTATPEPARPARSPVEDTDLLLAAAEAITAAGYRDVALEALERTDGWAWVAVVEARAPGEPTARPHEVWLRADVGRLVVAGTTAPRPGAPPTAETPTESPPTEPTSEPTAAEPATDETEATP